MSDAVEITSGELTACIAPLGAELVSLTDAAGREYMTNADPAFWTGHAPLLFPIVGALNQGQYRLGNRAYTLPKHGLARVSRFDLHDLGPNAARFRLSANEATRAAYPFEFVLDAEFALSGRTLAMTVTVANDGDEPLPFSFGFHPAFAWPLPDGGAKASHRIVFACDEPSPIRRIDPVTGTLRHGGQPTPVSGRTLVPDAALFEADAIIWDQLASRSLVFSGDNGTALELEFPDCPYLGIWQKPGAPFLAIEPWHGINDPAGFNGDFRDKPGMISLEPGGAQRFRMNITVRGH